MIEEIVIYRTSDGRDFETEDDAVFHETSKNLENFIKERCKFTEEHLNIYNITMSEALRIIMENHDEFIEMLRDQLG